MVGGLIRGKILLCGGGSIDQSDSCSTTDRCQVFDLQSYEWSETVSMLESRTYAQAVTLKNDTLFIIGGMDRDCLPRNSTEKLSRLMSSIRDVEVPLKVARHCAMLINATHVFVSGGLGGFGLYQRTLPRGNQGCTTCFQSESNLVEFCGVAGNGQTWKWSDKHF